VRLIGRYEGLVDKLAGYLDELCGSFPDRHVGGPGNRAATEFFALKAQDLGWRVQRTSFDCLDWEYGEAVLVAGDTRRRLFVGPYSLSCDVTAPLSAVSDIDALESSDPEGSVLLLHGEIAREQLMPKSFEFYNPEGHRRIITAIEHARPAAVIAATGRNPDLAGALYPFPLIEDGDFDIPNAYLKDTDGIDVLDHIGSPVVLRIDSRRIPAWAEHVVACRPGSSDDRRVVLLAHIDSKYGSPGALDNATGVVIMLAIAEALGSNVDGLPAVELVALNGEDHYAQPGEIHWLAENQDRFDEIILGINIDGAGHTGNSTAVSLYGCPPEVEAAASSLIRGHERLVEGEQWYQGDHGLLLMNERPAIAITSANFLEIASSVAHTDRDVPDLVDPSILVDVSRFVCELVSALG